MSTLRHSYVTEPGMAWHNVNQGQDHVNGTLHRMMRQNCKILCKDAGRFVYGDLKTYLWLVTIDQMGEVTHPFSAWAKASWPCRSSLADFGEHQHNWPLRRSANTVPAHHTQQRDSSSDTVHKTSTSNRSGLCVWPGYPDPAFSLRFQSNPKKPTQRTTRPSLQNGHGLLTSMEGSARVLFPGGTGVVHSRWSGSTFTSGCSWKTFTLKYGTGVTLCCFKKPLAI